jgi:hypothetical protein
VAVTVVEHDVGVAAVAGDEDVESFIKIASCCQVNPNYYERNVIFS